MITMIRYLLHVLIIRPFVWGVLGLDVHHRERLSGPAPAVIVANHNSHLDTLVLMSLFPLSTLKKIRPVAAQDYFDEGGLFRRLAAGFLGVIYLDRRCRPSGGNPLAACEKALADGHTLVVFPEGTRGRPESPGRFYPGVSHLARRHPEVPFIPVYLHGCGKTLPKGAMIPVPFICEIGIGTPVKWNGDKAAFLNLLRDGIFGPAQASCRQQAKGRSSVPVEPGFEYLHRLFRLLPEKAA